MLVYMPTIPSVVNADNKSGRAPLALFFGLIPEHGDCGGR
jgi:hypothetical protein